MLLRPFKVNNGALEVLEESITQEGRKLINKTKFSVDGKEGEFSAVMNSLCGEWELVYGDVYCSSNHEMDIPFTEEDLNAIYKYVTDLVLGLSHIRRPMIEFYLLM